VIPVISVEEPAAASEIKQGIEEKICPNCGQKNNAETIFCTECGKKI
jgi:hypothetical protein